MFNHPIFVIFLLISTSFFSSEVSSKQSLTLECKVLKELENNKPANSRMYNQKSLLIYIDKKNLWINDLSFENWLSQNPEYFEKIEKTFKEDAKRYFFRLRKFLGDGRQKLESSDLIKYEKFGGHFQFTKYFYNYEGEVFFSSDVIGQCKKK